jgi:hypothetical protein
VSELRPHPSYARHDLAVHATQLSALASRGDLAFQEPIVVTRSRTIIDGYARWRLAQQLHRTTLLCAEYDLTDAEALQCLIHRHSRSPGMNAFNRIVLALDLEQVLRERARSNQQAGGLNKGSSNLTEADKLDVRTEIAAIAGVSVGNVTKVRRLTQTSHPDVLRALREGEISIHRSWLWSKEPPKKQRDALWLFRSEKGIKKTIHILLRQRQPKRSPVVLVLGNLVERLSRFEPARLRLIPVAVIDAPGNSVLITEELFRALGAQEELPLA